MLPHQVREFNLARWKCRGCSGCGSTRGELQTAAEISTVLERGRCSLTIAPHPGPPAGFQREKSGIHSPLDGQVAAHIPTGRFSISITREVASKTIL